MPDGDSQSLRLYAFGPSGFKDYDSATLRCKICHMATLSPTKPVCDYATYMRLLAENADLQRTNGLLKLESGKSGLGETEKMEAMQTELKILSANNKGRSRFDTFCP